eukprot:3544699-Alexandrium_andersonii.AAC.1
MHARALFRPAPRECITRTRLRARRGCMAGGARVRPLGAVGGAPDREAAHWGCRRSRGRRRHSGWLRRAGHVGRQT